MAAFDWLARRSDSGELPVVSVGAGAPLAKGGFGGTGYAAFTGTVGRCGTGTLAWADQVVQAADGRSESTWRIVPGSGPVTSEAYDLPGRRRAASHSPSKAAIPPQWVSATAQAARLRGPSASRRTR